MCLRELGLPTEGLVASLFAFNAGVEIGQVAIVALVFPLIAWLSRQSYQRTVVLVVSAFIGLFGLGWFIEAGFGAGIHAAVRLLVSSSGSAVNETYNLTYLQIRFLELYVCNA